MNLGEIDWFMITANDADDTVRIGVQTELGEISLHVLVDPTVELLGAPNGSPNGPKGQINLNLSQAEYHGARAGLSTYSLVDVPPSSTHCKAYPCHYLAGVAGAGYAASGIFTNRTARQVDPDDVNPENMDMSFSDLGVFSIMATLYVE